MTDYNEFKWNNDDYQNDMGQYVEPAKYSETVKKKQSRPRIWLVSMASAMAGALIMSIASPFVSDWVSGLGEKEQFSLPPQNPPQTSVEPVVSSPDEAQLTTVEIGQKVGPAVVGIVSKVSYSGFFQREASGSGSGIILSSDGYIVTNNHVVTGATSLNVVLNTGKEYPASIIGTDERTDLAVIKIDATNLPTAVLGDSETLQAGERAIAIGNPLGQEFAGTLTQGIISALNRTVVVGNKSFTMIQTDAAINPGNSGGALVNGRGEVIGINTVKVSTTGVEGLGFAIPISDAKPIIEDLINFKYVKGRPLIGLNLQYISKQEADYYNLASEGLFVVDVFAGTGAANAGITKGDIILSCNDEEVKSVEELNEIRDRHKAGDTLHFKINRGGSVMNIDVVLTEDKPTLAQ